MAKITDPIFGEMEVKHGWQKIESIQFWGKSVNLKIKAAQYTNTGITATQQKNYQYTIGNITAIAEQCKKAITVYKEKIKQDGAVTPKSLIFFADGKYGILFDCAWDIEHGLAVTLPDYQVGSQDILL